MHTLEDQREFWLTFDALAVGLVYAFGPEALQTSGTFFYFTKFLPGGMDFVGWTCLGLVFVLLTNRFFFHIRHGQRVAHAIGFAIFTAQTLLVVAAVLNGHAQSGAGWIHLAVVAWLHFSAAKEQPVLRRRLSREEARPQDA
jgi:hypothetical protein